MKNSMVLIGTLALLVAVVGCGGSETEAEATSTPAAVDQADAPQQAIAKQVVPAVAKKDVVEEKAAAESAEEEAKPEQAEPEEADEQVAANAPGKPAADLGKDILKKKGKKKKRGRSRGSKEREEEEQEKAKSASKSKRSAESEAENSASPDKNGTDGEGVDEVAATEPLDLKVTVNDPRLAIAIFTGIIAKRIQDRVGFEGIGAMGLGMNGGFDADDGPVGNRRPRNRARGDDEDDDRRGRKKGARDGGRRGLSPGNRRRPAASKAPLKRPIAKPIAPKKEKSERRGLFRR